MNFVQQTSHYSHDGKARHYQRTYEYRNEQGQIHWTCDVYGQCISAPTVFTGLPDSDNVFTMTAKGKLLNATYFLHDRHNAQFAAITRKGFGFRWKLLGADGIEIARIVDPASLKEAFIRELFTALPDSYAVMQGDTLVARIANEKLLENQILKPRNKVGKFLGKFFTGHALTLRAEAKRPVNIDSRILLASLTLLQVHDIGGSARN
jgi:hypothetical protein